MAKVFGKITPSAGIGTKMINLGVSGITRFSVDAIRAGVGYVARCTGAWVSGTNRYIPSTEGWGALDAQAKFEIIDQAGVVVYQADCTGISGSVMSWDVTVATITPSLLINGDSMA